MLFNYHLLTLTDFVRGYDVKEMIGWSEILLICFGIFVVISAICFKTLTDLKWFARKTYYTKK